MKSTKLIIIVFGILSLMALYSRFKGPDESYFNDFDTFNRSNIYGSIKYVGVKSHAANFRIKGDSLDYVFSPISEEVLNNRNNFSGFAKRGDTVIKPSYSDTLILKKGSEIFKFTFRKAVR